MDEKNKEIKPHNLIMENREKLTITGVIDIHSFDDEIVLVETQNRYINYKR